MENLPLNISDLVEKYFHPLKIILSGSLLFGSGLLLAKTLEYLERPQLSYQKADTMDGEDMTGLNKKKKQEELLPLVVDVSGAVHIPGVYSLEDGARVNDALRKAGGLSEDADEDWVSRELNLASRLTDGEKIYIPRKGEVQEQRELNTAVKSGGEIRSANETTSSCPSKININSAPLEILTCLYNVGGKRAQAIIDYRNKHPFDNVEEISNIKGIGSKTLERIRSRIVVR